MSTSWSSSMTSPGLRALRQYFGFKEGLEQLLGRPVDLVEGTIENPFVLSSVEESKELLYAACRRGVPQGCRSGRGTRSGVRPRPPLGTWLPMLSSDGVERQLQIVGEASRSTQPVCGEDARSGSRFLLDREER